MKRANAAKAPAREDARVSEQASLQLIATAALCSAPLALDQPWTITALSTVLMLWRAWLSFSARPAPGKPILLGIALLGVALALANHHTLFGREAGLSLLALFLPLKLLETRTRRDARAVLLLCCFLLTGQFLNSQAIWIALLVLIDIIAIVAAAAAVEAPERGLRDTFTLGGRMFASALPIGLVLFMFFPRIDGPLWGLPRDAFSGKTGLSERMSPGSISQLIQSGEIAFRASFDGPLPPPALRYWRGPVLTEFDGREWSPRRGAVRQHPRYAPSGPRYDYVMTLEPHNQRWLLAMDYPGESAQPASGPDVQLFSDELSLISPQQQRTRSRRTLTAFPASAVGEADSTASLKAATALPMQSNPRTQSLGQQWLASEPDPAKRVALGIAFMRQAKLLYTLNPPLSGTNAADEFLFVTKKGFCEHFAGAFAILMRSAGVPTRVVTGYQGGEVNPIDGTLVIRQSDAHAWTEVWLANKGWVRVDPTAASAPSRIDNGIANALPSGDALPFVLRAEIPLLQLLRYRWESITNTWNQWVLGYNAERQMDFLRKMGLSDADWHTLAALLGLTGGIWLIWLLLRSLPRTRHADPLDIAWKNFCKKLARRGIPRHPWEPAAQFALRAGAELPLHADTINAIAEQYASLRYGARTDNTTEIAAFRAAIHRFKP